MFSHQSLCRWEPAFYRSCLSLRMERRPAWPAVGSDPQPLMGHTEAESCSPLKPDLASPCQQQPGVEGREEGML